MREVEEIINWLDSVNRWWHHQSQPKKILTYMWIPRLGLTGQIKQNPWSYLERELIRSLLSSLKRDRVAFLQNGFFGSLIIIFIMSYFSLLSVNHLLQLESESTEHIIIPISLTRVESNQPSPIRRCNEIFTYINEELIYNSWETTWDLPCLFSFPRVFNYESWFGRKNRRLSQGTIHRHSLKMCPYR